VHAKVCVVDDEWFTCGSDNFNRRSWTNDSELTCAVVGEGLARSVRSELWSEHLGGEPQLDPVEGFEQWRSVAAALDAWHASGRIGPRPPGQIRAHDPAPLGRLTKLWARPLYNHIYDPDGRPRKLRRHNDF
jgi:phosphatidylserine/phosphatidylglycerophosphate/cardiolipin synthase-like enzyme